MAKQLYNCEQVNLTHPQMLELRGSGDLNLGIDDRLATQIANAKGEGPNKTSANVAFHFWNWIAIGGLGYSIYLSFTDSWWWFIVGFIGVSVIWKANKKSNSENFLDAAMIDQEFYERVQEFGGWLYQIEETVAEKYLKDS